MTPAIAWYRLTRPRTAFAIAITYRRRTLMACPEPQQSDRSRECPVRRLCVLQRTVPVVDHHRVQRRVVPVHTVEVRLQQLHRRDRARAHGTGQLHRRPERKRLHRRARCRLLGHRVPPGLQTARDASAPHLERPVGRRRGANTGQCACPIRLAGRARAKRGAPREARPKRSGGPRRAKKLNARRQRRRSKACRSRGSRSSDRSASTRSRTSRPSATSRR